MLHWLQSALPKKQILFLQICCISLIFHIFIIIFSSIISLITTNPLNFTVHAQKLTDQPIYFMPLVKTVNQPVRRTAPKREIRSLSKFARTLRQAQGERPLMVSEVEPYERFGKKSIKKVDTKKIAIQKKTSRPVLAKTQSSKKIAENPVDPKVKKQAQELSKNFLKKKKLFEDFDLSKIPARIDPVEQKLEVTEEKLILGREDLASLKIYESIQEEVSQYWKPPVGLSKDLECKIKAAVDNSGKIKNIRSEQASGVLAYDMSARMAFMQVQMPKEVFGKEVILTFRQ